ncbi:uncharacterized protein KY384_005842 [Bacidia gigantensis]|uniref:uncharacterized protein n=1 Tax=Bacidia gigantensis TaxID=2732470 RepID=UPI001D037E7F|nr:uncharacterized protein KY384_005842 [Bacidia gigantensis]KAG8529207.1 hypothetical protein KY384_005842 [Bacidia gigantensis]
MPQERKQRGRRAERKRKRVDDERDVEPQGLMVSEIDSVPGAGEGFAAAQPQLTSSGLGDLTFYGLLTEQEQEYFKQADSLLENDRFATREERDLFLESVWKEAHNKELKLANSQSCSRLLERLILLSTPDQLTSMFENFKSHFLNLVRHRFASHCCEALFLRSASFVDENASTQSENHPTADLETGFLSVVAELQPHLGYLLTDAFASHVLRVLLIILAGLPTEGPQRATMLQSKRKENISIHKIAVMADEGDPSRTVPPSFGTALSRIFDCILAGLDASSIRALATHPVANPVLQILLELELTLSEKQSAKQPESLLRRMLPDEKLEEGTESVAFVKHLLYDPVGSRLLETIVSHAPGKMVKALYKHNFKMNIETLVRNEVASFVTMKVIERLSKEELKTAVERICSSLEVLIERSRTAVIKMLIEQSRKIGLDTQPVADAFQSSFGANVNEQIRSMILGDPLASKQPSSQNKNERGDGALSKVHGSLLMQTMLEAPDNLRELVNAALMSATNSELLDVAKDRGASRVLQAALTCSEQSLAVRRQLSQALLDSIVQLSTHPVASHVVDAMWTGSSGLNFLRERAANEIALNESVIRQTIPGKAIWRNWKMDVYKRRRKEWLEDGKGSSSSGKTGIELARERHIQRTGAQESHYHKKIKGASA